MAVLGGVAIAKVGYARKIPVSMRARVLRKIVLDSGNNDLLDWVQEL